MRRAGLFLMYHPVFLISNVITKEEKLQTNRTICSSRSMFLNILVFLVRILVKTWIKYRFYLYQ